MPFVLFHWNSYLSCRQQQSDFSCLFPKYANWGRIYKVQSMYGMHLRVCEPVRLHVSISIHVSHQALFKRLPLCVKCVQLIWNIVYVTKPWQPVHSGVNIINMKDDLGRQRIPPGPQFNTLMSLATLGVHTLIVKLWDGVNLLYSGSPTCKYKVLHEAKVVTSWKTTARTPKCVHAYSRSCDL